MTNLEMIRALNLREMAAFMKAVSLEKIGYCELDDAGGRNYNACKKHDCMACRTKWLMQEYEKKEKSGLPQSPLCGKKAEQGSGRNLPDAGQEEKGGLCDDAHRGASDDGGRDGAPANEDVGVDKSPMNCQFWQAMTTAGGKPYDCRRCRRECTWKEALAERAVLELRQKAALELRQKAAQESIF